MSARNQLWELAVLEQWATALRTPSMQRAHMGCPGPHTLGTEFIRYVIEESIRVWYAHAKVRATLPVPVVCIACALCVSVWMSAERGE